MEMVGSTCPSLACKVGARIRYKNYGSRYAAKNTWPPGKQGEGEFGCLVTARTSTTTWTKPTPPASATSVTAGDPGQPVPNLNPGVGCRLSKRRKGVCWEPTQCDTCEFFKRTLGDIVLWACPKCAEEDQGARRSYYSSGLCDRCDVFSITLTPLIL